MPFHGIDWKNEISNILKMGEEENTLKTIGEHYGVSKQRIKQVCQKYNIHKKLFGTGIRAERRKAAYKKKWGDRADSELYQAQRAKFRSKKANAKRIGIPWDIDFGDLTWPVYCPILGVEINYFSEGTSEESPSLDRLDSSKGYVKGNVAIMSWRANRIKNDGTKEEHQKIVDFMNKIGL